MNMQITEKHLQDVKDEAIAGVKKGVNDWVRFTVIGVLGVIAGGVGSYILAVGEFSRTIIPKLDAQDSKISILNESQLSLQAELGKMNLILSEIKGQNTAIITILNKSDK